MAARRHALALARRAARGLLAAERGGGGAAALLPRPAAAAVPAAAPLLSWARGAAAPLLGARGFAASGDLPPHELLAMPALSPTMSQGNIVAWKKAEGDAIAPGDVYCEVETDKATIEWEAQEEGFLARILAPAGAAGIDVGAPVAVIVEDEAAVPAFKDYAPGQAAAAAGAAPAPAAPAPGGSGGGGGGGAFPPHEVVAMPALSPTMSSGSIVAWRKAAGDAVSAGDVLAEVETDKATMEWEAQDEGVVAKLLAAEGAHVDVGAPVMVMVDDAAAVAAFEGFSAADAGGAPAAKAPAAAPAAKAPKAADKPAKKAAAVAPAPAAPAPAPAGGRVVASPHAKKLARDAGIDLAGVAGSGPGGRIVAADVEAAAAAGGGGRAGAPAAAAGGAPPARPAPPAGADEDVPTSQIRRVIAARLLESKTTVPHYYLTASCRVDALLAARAAVNAALAAGAPPGAPPPKVSVNDFVIKAAAAALRAVPDVNASWHGDFVRRHGSVDISVAVQTPAGLMVPIVFGADGLGLAGIGAEVRRLAARAKAGKLQPAEFTGGTFTVSNLGMYGVSQFAAIINPPQAAILAVGGTEARVVPARGGGFEAAQFMAVTLSCDHRVVDGAVGAQWLAAFRGYVENPATLLL